MATGWMIKRNDKENGPFSSQQLKKLASSGKLKPEDLIRKEPGGKYQRANAIKGLFPEEELEDASAGDSADFLSVDISRYGELPMDEEHEKFARAERRRAKAGTKAPPKAGAKSQSAGGKKKGKGKSGKKGEVDPEDDPIDDLFFGFVLVCFAIGTLFFMDPETYELPGFLVTTHEYTGRFGVAAAVLLLSLALFIPAFQKIQRLKSKGQKIPWHLPYMGWLFGSFYTSSEESEEE